MNKVKIKHFHLNIILKYCNTFFHFYNKKNKGVNFVKSYAPFKQHLIRKHISHFPGY